MTMREAVRRGALAAILFIVVVAVAWAASVFVLPRITVFVTACSVWIAGVRQKIPATAWNDIWQIVLAFILAQIVLSKIFDTNKSVKEIRAEIGGLAREIRLLRDELAHQESPGVDKKPPWSS